MLEKNHTKVNKPPIGVVLVNLGTPAAPTTKAVRCYLREFLSDRRVIDTPRIIWWFILNCIVLVTRPSKIAKLYKLIWTTDGSPLMAIGYRQSKALAIQLEKKYPKSYLVELAMTYGNPSIKNALQTLQNKGCKKVIILPLYPQYSATTTAAVFDQLARTLRNIVDIPEIRFIKEFHINTSYIDALAASINAHWCKQGKPDRLLISFHGIPEKYITAGDPYVSQCKATALALAQILQLPETSWMLSFQSRFGLAKWVKPYTDDVLTQWAKKNFKRIDVICPAFTADCLETLEEISVQNKQLYQQAGGGDYQYIAALNDNPEFITCLAELVESQR